MVTLAKKVDFCLLPLSFTYNSLVIKRIQEVVRKGEVFAPLPHLRLTLLRNWWQVCGPCFNVICLFICLFLCVCVCVCLFIYLSGEREGVGGGL